MNLLRSLVLLICIVATTQLAPNWNFIGINIQKNLEILSDKLNGFRNKYLKKYNSVNELTFRTTVFKKSLSIIDEHNKNPNRHYNLGVTRFTDLTSQEFDASILMPKYKFKETNINTAPAPTPTPTPVPTPVPTPSAYNVQNTNYFWNPYGYSPMQTPIPMQQWPMPFQNQMPMPNQMQWPMQPVVDPKKTNNKNQKNQKQKNDGPSIPQYAPITTATNPVPQQKKYVVDWRKKGVTGVVKEQGICGSCFAFAALGAIQSMYLINNMTSLGISGKVLGKTISSSLSQQHILDCCNVPGRCDMGCNGGYVWDTYDFIKNYGVEFESTYPYRAFDETYQKKCENINGQFKNILNPSSPYTNVTRKNVTDLKQKLMMGPVVVLMDATNLPFYVVQEGQNPIPFSNCSQTVNNHAVLLVGIDQKQNWLIKNSWGSQWGQDGYITLAPGNTCGISNYAVLPNPYR